MRAGSVYLDAYTGDEALDQPTKKQNAAVANSNLRKGSLNYKPAMDLVQEGKEQGTETSDGEIGMMDSVVDDHENQISD
jgi:hypothetical protein